MAKAQTLRASTDRENKAKVTEQVKPLIAGRRCVHVMIKWMSGWLGVMVAGCMGWVNEWVLLMCLPMFCWLERSGGLGV